MHTIRLIQRAPEGLAAHIGTDSCRQPSVQPQVQQPNRAGRQGRHHKRNRNRQQQRFSAGDSQLRCPLLHQLLAPQPRGIGQHRQKRQHCRLSTSAALLASITSKSTNCCMRRRRRRWVQSWASSWRKLGSDCAADSGGSGIQS